jgi:hypothetical protein
LERVRTTCCLAVVLLVGCSSPPPEVNLTDFTSDPTASSNEVSTGMPPGPTTDGSATVASAEGTAGSTEATDTLPLDDTTTSEPPLTSGSTEGPMSSTDGATTESTTDPPDCNPLLAEVFYDPQSGEDQEQWVKLYNACADDINLGNYSLGWAGPNYTFGRLDLSGTILAHQCFLVGGPLSLDDNAFPIFQQEEDFDPDLEKSGGDADGVALFFGEADGIGVATIPLDAVIYGGSNTSNLLDADGNTPDPHVDDAGDTESIRRTAAVPPVWIVESNPMPGLCPPF